MRHIVVVAVLLALSAVGVIVGEEASGSRDTTVVSEPETVAVATKGILYLFGNRLEPPFVFTIYNDTLWVNDYCFIGRREEPKREIPEESKRRMELSDSMYARVRKLQNQGVSYDSILAVASRVLLGSDLVDSVKVQEWGLLVWWHGEKYQPEHTLISPYPLPPPRPYAEFLRDRAKHIASGLQDGCIELIGKWPLGSGRAAELDEQIRKMRERGWAMPEDEIQFGAPFGGVDELLNPAPLKKRGEK